LTHEIESDGEVKHNDSDEEMKFANISFEIPIRTAIDTTSF